MHLVVSAGRALLAPAPTPENAGKMGVHKLFAPASHTRLARTARVGHYWGMKNATTAATKTTTTAFERSTTMKTTTTTTAAMEANRREGTKLFNIEFDV